MSKTTAMQIREIRIIKMDKLRSKLRTRASFRCGVRVTAVLMATVCLVWLVYTHTRMSFYTTKETSEESELPWLRESYKDRLKQKLIQTGRIDQLNTSQCKKRLPKAIIIGVMKAGTEAFSTFLGIHPQIAMQFGSTAAMFFNSDNYNKGYEWYKQLMTCSTSDQITMEKSPQYFSSTRAPERIHQMNKDIKLILLLRNPFDRAVSHFLQMQYSNPDKLIGQTFEECVMYPNKTVRSYSPFVFQSTYSVILKRWLQYFPLKQILIIDGDKFKTNALRPLHKCEDFLGIQKFLTTEQIYLNEEKGFYCIRINSTRLEDQELSCLGSGKGREHPDINPAVKRKLQKFFKPHNEALFKMIKHKFPW